MEPPITFETNQTKRLTHAYILCLLRCAAGEPGALQHLEWLQTQFTPEQQQILDTLATHHTTLIIQTHNQPPPTTQNMPEIIETYENTHWRNLNNYPLGNNPDQPPTNV